DLRRGFVDHLESLRPRLDEDEADRDVLHDRREPGALRVDLLRSLADAPFELGGEQAELRLVLTLLRDVLERPAHLASSVLAVRRASPSVDEDVVSIATDQTKLRVVHV